MSSIESMGPIILVALNDCIAAWNIGFQWAHGYGAGQGSPTRVTWIVRMETRITAERQVDPSASREIWDDKMEVMTEGSTRGGWERVVVIHVREEERDKNLCEAHLGACHLAVINANRATGEVCQDGKCQLRFPR